MNGLNDHRPYPVRFSCMADVKSAKTACPTRPRWIDGADTTRLCFGRRVSVPRAGTHMVTVEWYYTHETQSFDWLGRRVSTGKHHQLRGQLLLGPDIGWPAFYWIRNLRRLAGLQRTWGPANPVRCIPHRVLRVRPDRQKSNKQATQQQRLHPSRPIGVPLGKRIVDGPWVNLKLGLQFTRITSSRRAPPTYDGFGRTPENKHVPGLRLDGF